jgi:cardiolipin synthase C
MKREPHFITQKAIADLPRGASTRLSKFIQPLARAHPGKSGIFPLPLGRDAFAARMALAEAAESTLDIQYYIWHNDFSGNLLFQALKRAADRGVKVRLLLDDNNTEGLDGRLAELIANGNIEVRLFNPFKYRRWRWFNYLTDFSRLNRRMHNKSFTADDQATIVGGRNVGDEYFDAGSGVLFVDLDVLAVGAVADEVSRDFQRYWESESSVPAESVLALHTKSVAGGRAAANRADEETTLPFLDDLFAGRLDFDWAKTTFLSDEPAKGLGRAQRGDFLWEQLKRVINTPVKRFQLISAYFVPTAAGAEFFASLARRGIKVTVVTNSLEATDVAAVHAGYAKWHKPLLRAGVELFEIKRMFSAPAPKSHKLKGSSASSLHAKTFAVDGACVFVGSFNFDPRSAELNTEMGFVIESATRAQAIDRVLAEKMPTDAYRVRLGENGRLQWVEFVDGVARSREHEPAPLSRRMVVWLLSRFPIEWLL